GADLRGAGAHPRLRRPRGAGPVRGARGHLATCGRRAVRRSGGAPRDLRGELGQPGRRSGRSGHLPRAAPTLLARLLDSDRGLLVGTVLILGAAGCGGVALATARRGLDRASVAPTRARSLIAVACIAVLAGIVAVGPSAASRAGAEFTSGSYPGQQADPAARL